MGIYTNISLSAIRRKIVDQAECFENTLDFPSEEIPLGYRLRSGSDFDIKLRIGLDFISEHHFMIKSDPSSAWPRFSQSPILISSITLIWKCLRHLYLC